MLEDHERSWVGALAHLLLGNLALTHCVCRDVRNPGEYVPVTDKMRTAVCSKLLITHSRCNVLQALFIVLCQAKRTMDDYQTKLDQEVGCAWCRCCANMTAFARAVPTESHPQQARPRACAVVQVHRPILAGPWRLAPARTE